MRPRDVGNNWARLLGAVGRFITLETNHGAVRQGRLSGWTCRTLKINGVDVELPIELELNGDPYDRVSLVDIKILDIQSDREKPSGSSG